ncbi:uncharacterized protein LOC124934668 [Impatiens glandulifera]|uniref:uncharacterized protein LOC124934668 n=1 Tax=Impatiens glandulifera TaxID=253017 RepID=UPI001FB07B6C|nr:uncharacterized protein LOC124934668 [Impatiens glandulifera]
MKMGFVDGSCTKPEDPQDVILWKMIDAMVRSWIMHTIEKKARIHFQSATTSKELWDEIKSRYETDNWPTQYKLKKDICTAKQGNIDLEDYYSKVRLFWDEQLNLQPHRKYTCDRSQQDCVGCKLEKEVIMDYEKSNMLLFLMGLNDSYENLIDSILAMESKLTVYKAFTMFLNVEKKEKH